MDRWDYGSGHRFPRRRLLLDCPGTRSAQRDQDQAALQNAQLAQHPDAGVGLVALGIDIDQHGLSPLFTDPDRGISVVVAVAHPVPGRQLRLDFSLKVLIGRDQADHGQGLFGRGARAIQIGHCVILRSRRQMTRKMNQPSRVMERTAGPYATLRSG